MKPPDSPHLHYQPARRRTLRPWRWVLAALAVAAATVLWSHGKAWYAAAYRRYQWRRCTTFVGRPDQPASGCPACWTALGLAPAPPEMPGETVSTTFLHERMTDLGEPALVHVESTVLVFPPDKYVLGAGGMTREEFLKLHPETPDLRHVQVYFYYSISDRSMLPEFGPRVAPARTMVTADFDCLGTDSVVLYNGQPDPADGTHFTIGYSVQGVRGTIDGRVIHHVPRDETHAECYEVQLSVRDGPAAENNQGPLR